MVDGDVFVSHALQNADRNAPVPGAGNGCIDVFTTSGFLVAHRAGGGALNGPWLVVRAPLSFGRFGGDFLVSNTGDGRILVHGPKGGHLGTLHNTLTVRPIVIEGLHGLVFGGSDSSSPDQLLFTAGPSGATQGLYGMIEARSTN